MKGWEDQPEAGASFVEPLPFEAADDAEAAEAVFRLRVDAFVGLVRDVVDDEPLAVERLDGPVRLVVGLVVLIVLIVVIVDSEAPESASA